MKRNLLPRFRAYGSPRSKTCGRICGDGCNTSRNDDDWEPVQFELEFGDPPLALAEGVNLRGRIDLVEKNVTRDAFRVTDHKTGKRPDTIPRWVGAGRSLQ